MLTLYLLLICLALFLASLSPPGFGLRQWLMARIYTRVQRRHESHLAERKRELFAGLSGTVLEIGPGAGANFAYLPDAVTRWIGIEPNPYMHEELRQAAAKHGCEIEIRQFSAQGMAVDDGSVDAVVSTLVLCSVPDPGHVLADVRRVLKPGGRFVFVEHVAAPGGTRLRRMQGLVRAPWRYLACGCCLDRDLGQKIRAAGFGEVEFAEFRIPPGVAPALISPHISGQAIR